MSTLEWKIKDKKWLVRTKIYGCTKNRLSVIKSNVESSDSRSQKNAWNDEGSECYNKWDNSKLFNWKG